MSETTRFQAEASKSKGTAMLNASLDPAIKERAKRYVDEYGYESLSALVAEALTSYMNANEETRVADCD